MSRYVAVKEDITERKRAQEELALARDQALAASRYKTELMAKVSHELRTPLGAIMGYAEFLDKEMFAPLTVQQKHFTREILDSINYLNGLVNDLLDEAQMERGKIQIQPAPFDVRQMAGQLTVRPETGGSGQRSGFLAVRGARTARQPVWRSETHPPNTHQLDRQCRQVHRHWLGHGSDPASRPAALVDTGDRYRTGHVPRSAGRIFEAFWQADGSPTRQHKGYGLGLSIVKQLTDLMGGEISVQSEVNRGSTFCVVLPIHRIY